METIRLTYTEGLWLPLLLTVNMLGLYGIIITLLWRDKKRCSCKEREIDNSDENML